jgi:cell division control protein 7
MLSNAECFPAIDIWAAGVIMLSVLSHKFPVFNSSDDVEALMEIGAVFGSNTLTRCAILHSECPLREANLHRDRDV